MEERKRKLASIRIISNVEKHPDADSLDICTVDGWRVITKLNEFKIGDKVIYFEIDSFLPVKPEFEFLRNSSFRKMGQEEGFRIRTIKLRGQISQGLLLPASILENHSVYSYGDDVTDIIGVQKWEPPVPAHLSGLVKGLFPSFIPKTDEERCQNLKSKWELFKSQSYYLAEKLDGSSVTYYIKDGVFGVCSRNLELKFDENNTYWKWAIENKIEDKLKSLSNNISLQGEIIGDGIQKNIYKIRGHKVYFYNIFDIDKSQYLPFDDFIRTIQNLGLETVPILDFGIELPQSPEELLSLAEGKSVLNPQTEREGLVVRSLDRKISFKAISNKFLLKHE